MLIPRIAFAAMTPMGVFQDRTSLDRILFAVFTHENKMQGRSPASVRSSSVPARRLYPTTSATRIAAIFRVDAMARPLAPRRIAQ